MKRFGVGAIVGFVTVFGSFYLIGMRGEAGEHAFEELISAKEEAPLEEGSKTFSALGEPSVQDSKLEAANTKSKQELKRVPSSGDDEMQVTLRKAKEPKQLIEEKPMPQKIAMVESKTPSNTHRESVAAGSYSVQVASHTDKAASEVALEQLQAKGFQGYIQPATVNDKQYYRVRLGPVGSKDEANSIKEKVTQIKGYSGAIVSRE